MLKKFVRWILGYLLVEFQGFYPEQFCNICTVRGIYVWGLSCRNGKCTVFIKLSDYKKIRPVARKTKTVPYIKKRYGLPFLIQKIRKRKGYYIGILTFCMILFLMSRYIWDIGIEGQSRHTTEQMITYLKTIKVYSGCRIAEIDCPKIEECVRRDFPDIGWVSAQIKGTRLIVSIVETTIPVLDSEKKNTTLPYADIIAARDGIIYQITTKNGTPKREIGSIVKKGDILISGVIPIIGDEGVPKDYKLVVADGTIELKTYREYYDSFPMKYQYNDYTGKVTKGIGFEAFTKKIFHISPSNSYEHYDIIKDVDTLKIARNFYLPFCITHTAVYEYTVKTATYTKAQAQEKANTALLREIEELKKQGVCIVENQVQITIENGVCYSQGKIIVKEPAWDYSQIEDGEWRKTEIDEHSGDNN